MKTLTAWKEVRQACDDARQQGRVVGFVPTMGALHRGHLTLVEVARDRCDFVVVSVFVNPTQFGQNEDLDAYPRTVEADQTASELAGADVFFLPKPAELYLPGDEARVRVGTTATHLCGISRPEHFEGVATVVTKLFGIVGPCRAFFGQKDYQQLQLIRRMVTDLFLPIEVVGVPTVREPDGLAMSSRNRYLSTQERLLATGLPQALATAARDFQSGQRSRVTLHRQVLEALKTLGDVDYVTLADPNTVQPLGGEALPPEVLLAVAVHVGKTRLIDNIVLGRDPLPSEWSFSRKP